MKDLSGYLKIGAAAVVLETMWLRHWIAFSEPTPGHFTVNVNLPLWAATAIICVAFCARDARVSFGCGAREQ